MQVDDGCRWRLGCRIIVAALGGAPRRIPRVNRRRDPRAAVQRATAEPPGAQLDADILEGTGKPALCGLKGEGQSAHSSVGGVFFPHM